MLEEIEKGDSVSVRYTSERSGNAVSRTGTVLQTPGNDKEGLFVQTDTSQLTGVMKGQVYSLTVDMNGEERTITRNTFVGDLDTVEVTES